MYLSRRHAMTIFMGIKQWHMYSYKANTDERHILFTPFKGGERADRAQPPHPNIWGRRTYIFATGNIYSQGIKMK